MCAKLEGNVCKIAKLEGNVCKIAKLEGNLSKRKKYIYLKKTCNCWNHSCCIKTPNKSATWENMFFSKVADLLCNHFCMLNIIKSFIVQMFRNSFWSSRSSSWDKDLLLRINAYKTLKNVHRKWILDSFSGHKIHLITRLLLRHSDAIPIKHHSAIGLLFNYIKRDYSGF